MVLPTNVWIQSDSTRCKVINYNIDNVLSVMYHNYIVVSSSYQVVGNDTLLLSGYAYHLNDLVSLYLDLISAYTVSIVELPIPNIGDINELHRETAKLRTQNNNTTMLGLQFHELNEIDSIKVDLVPEKKGVILKHVEYNVSSQVSLFAGKKVFFL